MENQELHRSGIRKSLLSGLGTMNPNATRGGLTDEENARSLAKRLFEFYNKDQTGQIADYEISSMISDVYKAIGKQYTPTEEDIKSYTKVVDADKDGKITLRDVESLLVKYLV